MKILITGSDGQIGWELIRAFPASHEVHGTQRTTLDLSKPDSIRACIRALRPDVIINPAAYTAVDRAESEPDAARAVNAIAPGIIGAEARAIGAAVVHFSTDYIFDGSKRTPYLPADAPNPQSVYGATKLEGEQALIASGARHVILRTCWVYGMRGRNFVLAILRAAATQQQLRIVNDQAGCPTWCRMAATVAASIVGGSVEGEPGDRHFGGREGVYHVAGAGQTTWLEFAQAVFEDALVRPEPVIVPVTTAEYGAPARRPAWSVLDCSATESAFGVKMTPWRAALQAALAERAI